MTENFLTQVKEVISSPQSMLEMVPQLVWESVLFHRGLNALLLTDSGKTPFSSTGTRTSSTYFGISIKKVY